MNLDYNLNNEYFFMINLIIYFLINIFDLIQPCLHIISGKKVVDFCQKCIHWFISSEVYTASIQKLALLVCTAKSTATLLDAFLCE